MRRTVGGLLAGLLLTGVLVPLVPAAAVAAPADDSIWATPIGRAARYVPADLTVPGVGVDVVTVATATATDRPAAVLTAGCAGPDRTRRLPASLDLPDTPSTLVLVAPGGRVADTWTAARRCGSTVGGQYAGRVALDGDGVPLRGTVAGLPGAGGALTAGELTGAQPVRHALALLVPAAVLAQGTRWPAVRTDGTQAAAGSGLRLGALLALTPAVAARLAPASPAARRLVAALRDHGAYVAGVADGDAVELRVARTPGTPADAVAVPATVRAALTPALRALAVVDDNAPGTPGGASARRPDAAPAPSPSATPRAAAPTPEASPPPAVVGTAAAQASTSRPTTPRESAPAGALAAIAVLAVGLLVAGLRAGRSAARLFTT